MKVYYYFSGNLLWTFYLHWFTSSWNYKWSNGSSKYHWRWYSQKEIFSNCKNCCFTQFRFKFQIRYISFWRKVIWKEILRYSDEVRLFESGLGLGYSLWVFMGWLPPGFPLSGFLVFELNLTSTLSTGKKSSGEKSSFGPKTSEDTKGGGESSEPETLLTKEQMDSFKPGFDKFMDSLSEDFDKSQFSTRQSSLKPRSQKPSVSGMAGMGSGKISVSYYVFYPW